MRSTSRLMAGLLTLLLLLVTAGQANSQFVSNVSKVGTTAAPFLEIGVGARATAMGGAFVGVADDVSAIYWNPAGTPQLVQGEIGFVHTAWIAGIAFDNVAATFPMGNGMTIGGFLTALSMDEMEVRTIEMPEGTGELFRASDVAFGLSYGWQLTDRLSVGANGKYIRQAIWNSSASAIAADLGLLFKMPFYNGVNLGMSVSNFGPDMQMTGRDTQVTHDIDPNNPGNNGDILADLQTDSWSLPLLFRVGVASNVWQGVNSRLLLAVDAIHPNDNYEYVNVGAEWSIRDFVFLRGGYRTLFLEDSEQGLTLGAGLRYRMPGNMIFVADMAYADFGRLDNVLRYSLGVRF